MSQLSCIATWGHPSAKGKTEEGELRVGRKKGRDNVGGRGKKGERAGEEKEGKCGKGKRSLTLPERLCIYLRTLWRYTNAVIIIIINKNLPLYVH